MPAVRRIHNILKRQRPRAFPILYNIQRALLRISRNSQCLVIWVRVHHASQDEKEDECGAEYTLQIAADHVIYVHWV